MSSGNQQVGQTFAAVAVLAAGQKEKVYFQVHISLDFGFAGLLGKCRLRGIASTG